MRHSFFTLGCFAFLCIRMNGLGLCRPVDWNTRGCPRNVLVVLPVFFLVLLFAAGAAVAAPGQNVPTDTLSIDIEDAVRLAIAQNRGLRLSEAELELAEADIGEARSVLRPQVTADAGYTRNIRAVDPFAGTPATDLLTPAVPDEWLAFNERARTDGNPDTEPISLDEFQQRQQEAFEQAGVSPDDPAVSPFTVPNQFDGGISISQTLFDPAAAARLRGARALRDASGAAYKRTELVTADSVRRAFLSTQLAAEQVELIRRSINRTEDQLQEAERRVEEGVASISERLVASVELGNFRTDLIDAETRHERARNALKLTLGIDPVRPIRLLGDLEITDGYELADFSLQEALDIARNERTDIQEARRLQASQQANLDASRAARLPRVNAFANLNLAGNIPDERDRIITDPLDPFDVRVDERGIFSDDFWSVGASAGIQLQISLFEGGRLGVQSQQARIAVKQAQIQTDQLEDSIRAEVQDALNELRAARDRVEIQTETSQIAERSFEIANERFLRGVVAQIERRDAAAQLDQSRLNLLQATHDYLSARSRFLTAMGITPEQI